VFRVSCGVILCCASAAACAVGPYSLHAPVAANFPQGGALLGFSVGAARAPASRVVAAGALGRHVGVYRFALNGPLQWQQTLLSDSTDDNFAISVAVSAAPREWLAIGASGDDRAVFNAGRVDIYGLDINNNYALTLRLLSPNPVSAGNYGSTVALDGDLLAVGEPKAASLNDGAEVGAVHLYAAVGNNWLFQTSLYGGQAGGRFGQSVALNAGTLVVGSPLFDDIGGGLTDVGAVHFFVGSGVSWQAQGTLMGVGRADSDRLGISVAVDANTAIGGAANDDKVAGADAGSAFVFTRQGSTWTEQARLRSSQPQNQERFAQSVSIAGDEALLGAYCLSPNCIGPGALYVFRRTAGVWTVLQRLAPASVGADSFGHASSHAGGGRAVVGAFGADLSGPADQGAVYGLTPVSLFQNGFE